MIQLEKLHICAGNATLHHYGFPTPRSWESYTTLHITCGYKRKSNLQQASSMELTWQTLCVRPSLSSFELHRSSCIMQERTAIPGHGEPSRIFTSSSGKRSTSTQESPWRGIGIHDNATATRALHELFMQGDALTSLRAYAGPTSVPEAVNYPSLIRGTLE